MIRTIPIGTQRANCFACVLPFILISCANAAEPATNALADIPPVNATLDFKLANNYIAIAAVPTLPGKYFIVDTGAEICVLDTKTFPEMKTQPFKGAATNPVRFVRYPPHVSVGPFDLATMGYCAATNLSQLTKDAGIPIAGIIGANAFTNEILQIDFEHQKLNLIVQSMNPQPDWGSARKLLRKHGVWMSKFDIDGKNTELSIDSGSGAFIDADSAMQSIYRTRPDVIVIKKSRITIEGSETDERFVVKQIKVDGREYRDANIDGRNYQQISGVGTRYLRDFLVTMDFKKGLLYLKPREGSASKAK